MIQMMVVYEYPANIILATLVHSLKGEAYEQLIWVQLVFTYVILAVA